MTVKSITLANSDDYLLRQIELRRGTTRSAIIQEAVRHVTAATPNEVGQDAVIDRTERLDRHGSKIVSAHVSGQMAAAINVSRSRRADRSLMCCATLFAPSCDAGAHCQRRVRGCRKLEKLNNSC